MMLPSWKMLPVLVASLGVLVGCGRAQYAAQNQSSTSVAGQYAYTKPQADIVVFQDDTDSVMLQGPIQHLKGQMQHFLSRMNNEWDVHFTVLPLTRQKALGGKYIVAQDCSSILAGYSCLNLSQIGYFNNASGDAGWIQTVNSGTGSNDRAFENINANLRQNAMVSSGFFRPKAATFVVVVSNGEDTTQVAYAPGPGGTMELDYTSATTINSFQQYKNLIKNVKGNLSPLKFYSVVSMNLVDNCQGGRAFRGKRYMDMSDALGSKYYDICAGGLTGVMNDIANQMQVTVQTYVFNYVLLEGEPASINSVKKNGQSLPQDATNGWTYVGYQQNLNTSYFPVPSNPKTGYFIKLNGTAEIQGTDTIEVNITKK